MTVGAYAPPPELSPTMTTSYVPEGSGQKTKPPEEVVEVVMKMRSMPAESFCSSATMTEPLMGLPVALSTTVPLMEDDVVETSPAWRTGFRRYLPLPSCTMEIQGLKSM